ncbi:MAG: type II toxin-antitoxin system HicB family antitoxin [Nitrospirae bacterium]|nr:type II toxin-antitoxin system HicB family antitoxin [Nitrospirota bacterium]
MKSFKYVIYREGKYYVSQCLNIDIASCGDSIEEAMNNLKDAVKLYFHNEPKKKRAAFHDIGDALIGETKIYA